MSWLDRIFRPPSASSPLPWDDFWYQQSGVETESGPTVSAESSLKTSAVFACVRLLAETVGSMPLHLYRRTPDGGRERATDHPLYEVLQCRPNSWQSPMEFREMMQAHVSLRGNAYAMVVPGKLGWVTELWPLHPDRVRVMLAGQNKLVYDYTDRLGQTIRLLPGEILHIRFLSLDGYIGLTPISYARETVGRQLAMERSNSRFHKNDATPRIVLKHPDLITPEAQERFSASWNATYGGYANAHKVAIIEEGMDVVSLGLKPQDSQFVESWEGGLSDLCRWFGVHPRKIGAKSGDSQTYANVEQAQIEHITDTVLPLCSRWEQAIDRDLLLPDERGEYYTEFMLDGLLRADAVARATLYEKALGKWMTQNEIRARENLPPVEGGDEMSPRDAAPASQRDAPSTPPATEPDQDDAALDSEVA